MAITPTSITALTGALLTGKTTWGPITPTAGAVTIEIVIDRTTLSLLVQPLSWALELSTDAGVTWKPWGGATCAAGTITLALVVQTQSSFLVDLPAPADANTRLRGSITALEPLTNSITVKMT
jgi:hypothetical protein